MLSLVLRAQTTSRIQGHLLHVLFVNLAIPEALEMPDLSVFTTLSSISLLFEATCPIQNCHIKTMKLMSISQRGAYHTT